MESAIRPGNSEGKHIGANRSPSSGSGKKRLDARSYRDSLLKGHEKKSHEPAHKKLKKHGEASQEGSEHAEASTSKKVDEINEGIVRNREEVGVSNGAESSDREKGKIQFDEFEDCDNIYGSPVSKFCYDTRQPAPGLSTKEVANTAELQVGCSTKGTSAEVSLGSTKRKKKLEELDSDASIMATNEVIDSSAEHVTPGSNKGSILEHCDACSKRQRSEGISENCNMCSCNYRKNHDASNIFSLEAGGELTSKSCIGVNDEFHDKMHPKESFMENKIDSERISCTICKLGGKLMSCYGKGCKTNYHIYCVDPPLKAVPPGVWHCVQCIKRKIQFGVYSVSEGIESVCDIREEEVPDHAGFKKQKQYLVKYIGLAHVHSRWVPEDELFLEVPSLVTKLKKMQTPKWKPEWSTPQRLILKRVLMSSTLWDESPNNCQYEWLVKWSGLGYEHATWELENAAFLRSTKAISLIRDYESRRERAIWVSDPTNEKILEKKKLTSFKLSELPGSNFGLHNNHLNFVNKLRECWSRNENAVVMENQERILKVVSFIQSMESDVCRPFLVISTSCSISAWESEFMRVAPSINVVAYNGNKDVRESVRALEFYEDGGCVMLQVLLSPIDAVIEDLEALEFIGWEAIIVDECQLPRVSRHFEQINKLTHVFKLLLLNGRVKETIAEYLNLLTFVESGDGLNANGSVKDDSGDTISKLKERFARYIVCEGELESSKFVEYWVPVQLSYVQREQYCATLLANSFSLCSCTKNDPFGALAEILTSVRKCCDHPYLVDPSLQSLLRKDLSEVEYLDVEVNASGKIQVLDKILLEIKKRGLRVLILFQSVEHSGRNYIGELLEDLLRQRFGQDSYERIDNGLSTSKKQAALNMFNNRERGRFVFLTDYRSCKQSVKLSSIDLVILFNSSWNPLNDLKALEKISIDSQFEQVDVFRLYSCCTVEEKVLSLAKQAVALDSNNIKNINCSTSHTLLLWGAHFQFHKLDEFHSGCTPCSGSNVQQSFVNDLVQAALNQLQNGSEINESNSCYIVSKAPQRGESYTEDIPLAGEKEMQSKDEELPHVSWKNLLDGRCPQWRYASVSSQRIRKKVQNFDELPEIRQENDEPAKKRKKVVSNTNESSTLKCCLGNKRKLVIMDKEGVSATVSSIGTPNVLASTDNENSAKHNLLDNWHDSQKNLHLSLKPLILKLCEILLIPDEVKSVAGRFLEYIMNNHRVNPEPVSIYHAFQISLCWCAASLSNYKISRKNSLSLVKQHLDFQCTEEEANIIYSKLQMLSKMFRQQVKSVESNIAENTSPGDKENLHLQSRASQSNLSAQQPLGEDIKENPKNHKCGDQLGSPQQRQTADFESPSLSAGKGSSKSIKKAQKIHSRRMKQLYQQQREEFEEFNKYKKVIMEKERAELEVKHKLESALIHNLHKQSSVKLEKQKKVDQEFTRKKEELDIHMKSAQGKLEAMQRKARYEEKMKKTHWLEEAKSGRSVAAYAMLPLLDSGFSVENMDGIGKGDLGHDGRGSGFREERIDDCEEDYHEKSTTSCMSSSEKQDASVSLVEAVAVGSCTIVPDEEAAIVSEIPPLFAAQLGEGDVNVNTSVSEYASDTGSMQQIKPCGSASDSPSLGQTLLCPLVDKEHAALVQDGQVPLLKVPVNEDAAADSVAFNQVNDGSTEQPTSTLVTDGQIDEHFEPLIQQQQEHVSCAVSQQCHVLDPIAADEQIQRQPPKTTTSLLPENQFASQAPPPLSCRQTVSQPSVRPNITSSWAAASQQLLDPLQNELGRLRRDQEQATKMHEDEKKRMRTECEKEVEEMRKKYNNMLQQVEMESAEKKAALEASYNIVYKNWILAEAFRLKARASAPAPAPGLQLPQHRPTATATFHGPSKAPPPPLQTVYQPSALFSSNPVTQAHSRAPAPHLQRYRPASPSQQPRGYVPAIPCQSTQQAPYNYGLSSLELLADIERIPNPRGSGLSSRTL